MEASNLSLRYLVLSAQRWVGSKTCSLKWSKKVIKLSKDKNSHNERLNSNSTLKIKAKTCESKPKTSKIAQRIS